GHSPNARGRRRRPSAPHATRCSCLTIASVIAAPAGMSRAARFPTSRGYSSGASPGAFAPLRNTRMLSSVKASPAPIARTEKTDRRAKPCSSRSTARTSLSPVPRMAWASRTARTNSLSYSGSTANFWSAPGRRFDSVKCFSMTTAPTAPATTGSLAAIEHPTDARQVARLVRRDLKGRHVRVKGGDPCFVEGRAEEVDRPRAAMVSENRHPLDRHLHRLDDVVDRALVPEVLGLP